MSAEPLLAGPRKGIQKLCVGVGVLMLVGGLGELVVKKLTSEGAGSAYEEATVGAFTAEAPLLDALTTPLLDRPIVGILSLPLSLEFRQQHHVNIPSNVRAIIPASYVKWLQAAGAQVVVIPHFWESTRIEELVGKLSGILFTGGDYGDEAWNATTAMIFHQALKRNGTDRELALWGTCLGYERIVQVASQNEVSAVVDARLIDQSITVQWTEATSPFLEFMGPKHLAEFDRLPIAYNFHNFGVTPVSWAANRDRLDPLFNVLGMHSLSSGLSFVAMIEGKNGLPVFGVQFHPEKALFEWSPNLHYPHSETAVMSNRRIADFFIHQVRQTKFNGFQNFEDESRFAIYNYRSIFTGISTNTSGAVFTETYIIDK